MRPLGFGSTNTVAPSKSSSWIPSVTGSAAGRRKTRSKQRHADERNDARTPTPDLTPQNTLTGDVLARLQRVDSGRASGDQIRDAEAEFDEPMILFAADRLKHEARLE